MQRSKQTAATGAAPVIANHSRAAIRAVVACLMLLSSLVIAVPGASAAPVTVDGHVRDQHGVEIGNVLMTYTGTNGGGTFATTTATQGAVGYYSIDLEPGSYSLFIDPPDASGYGELTIGVVVTGPVTRDIPLNPATSSFSGVLSVGGVSVDGAYVAVNDWVSGSFVSSSTGESPLA